MAMDLYASASAGSFRAHASLGVGRRAEPAAVTRPSGDALYAVSREHWFGVLLDDETVFARVGRVSIPFGLRNVEHTSWVRTLTHSDVNTAQQHGVSVAYNNGAVRGEVMGIIGNFQVSPDSYRERGYSLFGEWAVGKSTAVGLSSSLAVADQDLQSGQGLLRNAHGLFGRWAPTSRLALMAETDLVLTTFTRTHATDVGMVAWGQADQEWVQGFHTMVSAEAILGKTVLPRGVGGWITLAWFPLPHLELRSDFILRRTSIPGALSSTLMFQAHVYL